MTKKKRNKSNKSHGAPLWLTTYSDLVTLLLCFFILLYSMSVVDAEKFRNVMNSFQGGTGVLEGSETLNFEFNDIGDNDDEEEIIIDTELDFLKGDLEILFNTLNLEGKIEIIPEQRGIVIRFLDDVFFDSGSALVKTNSFEMLTKVAEILNREEFKERHIKVEGHTDSVPTLANSNYPTNWELSSARATNVLRYLVENSNIKGNRISSSGYSLYRNVAPNDTPDNRTKNRRVDIVILKDVFQKLEP